MSSLTFRVSFPRLSLHSSSCLWRNRVEGGARKAVGYSPGMCARSRSLRLSQRRARADRQKTRVRAQLRGRSGSAKRRQGEKAAGAGEWWRWARRRDNFGSVKLKRLTSFRGLARWNNKEVRGWESCSPWCGVLCWNIVNNSCWNCHNELSRARYQRSLLLNCWPTKLKLVALFFKSMFGGADVLSNV